MGKDKGDMDLAIGVPQPRLRAVPSEPVPQPLGDSPSDAELLTRVGERDREAFETLYGRYVRPVFGLALRRLGDRGHAEDAVQEAFAAIWRSASTYRPGRGAATAGAERERLQRAHEMLLEAGPPPELSDKLEAGPTLALTLSKPRRVARPRALLLLAAALAILVVFFAGYGVGNHRKGKST